MGQIFVIDFSAGTDTRGALFRVNPVTGVRTLLSDFGVASVPGEPLGDRLFGVAVVPIAASEVTCAGLSPTTGCTVNGMPNRLCQGTMGKDTITGTLRGDVILGLGGNDTINGGRGSDLVCGGTGSDEIRGMMGRDTMFGEDGNDRLFGGEDDDTLNGGNGNDYMDGVDGTADTCNGGSGSDRAFRCETVTSVP